MLDSELSYDLCLYGAISVITTLRTLVLFAIEAPIILIDPKFLSSTSSPARSKLNAGVTALPGGSIMATV